MAELDKHIKRIAEKLQLLLKNFTSLQKENEKLKTELQQIKAKEKDKDEKLQLLILRIEVLKASKGAMTEEEKRNFEKTLNQYLKEIDKCIALLNE